MYLVVAGSERLDNNQMHLTSGGPANEVARAPRARHHEVAARR
jgi:hypothetical protein